MKIFLRANSTLLVFICVMFIQLFVFVYLRNWPSYHTPPGRALAVNLDDSYYIAVIRQSMDGAWKFTEPHTTRPTPPIVIYVLYILGGKFASMFHIDPIAMYEILRIMGALCAYIASFLFIYKILPKSLHILGILCTFCVETGPVVAEILTKSFTTWTASAVGRVIISHQFDSAHHRLGEAAAIFLLILFMSSGKKYSALFYLGIILLTISATVLSPSAVGVFALTIYIPYAIVHAVRTRSIRTVFPVIITLGIIGVLGVWMKSEFAKGQPWGTFNEFESGWFSTTTILTQYLTSSLLYYPWIAFYFLTRKRKTTPTIDTSVPWLMGIWAFFPAILIYAKPNLPLVPFANWRIAWGIPTLPFAILATLGMSSLIQYSKPKKLLAYCVIALFFLCSFSLSLQFLKNLQNSKEYTNSPQIYPPEDLLKSFYFLHTLPKQSGVLTAPTYGSIIPAYADVRTFIGPPHAYLDWNDRNWLSYYFFAQTRSIVVASEFLKANDISYVFYGPEEQSYGKFNTSLYPDLLTPVFTLPAVTIYEVNGQK